MDRSRALGKITSYFKSFSKVKAVNHSLCRILNLDNIIRKPHKWGWGVRWIGQVFPEQTWARASYPQPWVWQDASTTPDLGCREAETAELLTRVGIQGQMTQGAAGSLRALSHRNNNKRENEGDIQSSPFTQAHIGPHICTRVHACMHTHTATTHMHIHKEDH